MQLKPVTPAGFFLKITMDKEKLTAEEEEVKLLIDEGFIFETKSRFSKSKTRKWHIKPLLYGTILQANKYAMQIKINNTADSFATVAEHQNKTVLPLFNFIATCYLGGYFKIKLLRWFFSWYFMWKIQPKDSYKMSLAIMQMYDLKNFYYSIGMIQTITSPQQKAINPNPIDGLSPD